MSTFYPTHFDPVIFHRGKVLLRRKEAAPFLGRKRGLAKTFDAGRCRDIGSMPGLAGENEILMHLFFGGLKSETKITLFPPLPEKDRKLKSVYQVA